MTGGDGSNVGEGLIDRACRKLLLRQRQPQCPELAVLAPLSSLCAEVLDLRTPDLHARFFPLLFWNTEEHGLQEPFPISKASARQRCLPSLVMQPSTLELRMHVS